MYSEHYFDMTQGQYESIWNFSARMKSLCIRSTFRFAANAIHR